MLYNVVLIFVSVDEILECYHIKTKATKEYCDAVCYAVQGESYFCG